MEWKRQLEVVGEERASSGRLGFVEFVNETMSHKVDTK